MGVDGFLGLRREDDHVGICILGPRIEVVGIVACHTVSICGFGLGGDPIGGRDHLATNCCALQ